MRKLGHAQTYVSQAVTNRFYVIDRAMFALSPYITFEEAEKICFELEKLAQSRTEGNFSSDDAFNWLAEQLGPARYQAVTMMWNINSQNAIKQVFTPEQLRPAFIHKITMTEATPEEYAKTPDNYIEIQTTRDAYR